MWRNPATFLHAYSCLPLAYATRQAAGSILQDVAGSGVLFSLLMCKHKVISLVGAQKASLHPDDILLLSNFIMSSESFKTSESFSPICLPRYNPMAFLYAYVHYFDIDTYLVLLTTSPDAFYHLKESRIRIENVLVKSNVLIEVQRSLVDGGMHIEDLLVDPTARPGTISSHLGQPRLATDSPSRGATDGFVGIGGPAGLCHFMYRSIYLDQYVSSEFSLPINSLRQQKRLYRAYQKLYTSMHDKGIGPHKTQFRRDENYVLLCWVTQDFELYAAFDILADKALAINVCNRVCQWVKDVENEIFLLGASPFSW
ncbi:SAND family protein [Striga hermonthica]|uniref:Vacuolar fusion protein MON1 homolog n=1 Tax=Striga hermonthica TaxID=68872 RepID=A0A9N7NQ76_STRHE|nr:SAND family protein [Striga hermonthica]